MAIALQSVEGCLAATGGGTARSTRRHFRPEKRPLICLSGPLELRSHRSHQRYVIMSEGLKISSSCNKPDQFDIILGARCGGRSQWPEFPLQKREVYAVLRNVRHHIGARSFERHEVVPTETNQRIIFVHPHMVCRIQVEDRGMRDRNCGPLCVICILKS